MVGRARIFGREIREDVREPFPKRFRRDFPPSMNILEGLRPENDRDIFERPIYQDLEDDEEQEYQEHDEEEHQYISYAYQQDEDNIEVQVVDEEEVYPEDNGDDEPINGHIEEEEEEPNYEPISDEPINVILNDPRIFDCSICFEPLTIPVFQCENNGHIACSSCSSKIHRCPSCPSPFGSSRCRIIEKVLESITTSCRNRKHGCKETMTYDKKREHEGACMHLPCSCPHPGCDFVASYGNLYKHFRTNHASSATRFRFNSEFSITLKKNEKFSVLQERNQGTMFVVKNRVIEGVGNAVRLHCLQPSFLKESYYKLDAMSTNENVLRLQSYTKSSPNCVYDGPPSSMATFLLLPLDFFRSGDQLRMNLCILPNGVPLPPT